MTQEELYIRFLNKNDRVNPSEVDPEFLKNYEIAKLALGKFGIHYLNENQQRNLNPEAISNWLSNSEYICLEYNIPEILELLPERIVGNLNLENSQIQTLPELKLVGWNLYLQNSQIKFLPELESVGDGLYLQNSQIQSLPELESVGSVLFLQNSQIQALPKLKSVGGSLKLRNSQVQSLPELESIGRDLNLAYSKIQDLPKLESVGGGLYLRDSKVQTLPKLEFVKYYIIVDKNKVDYWKNYFRETGRPDLKEKVKE